MQRRIGSDKNDAKRPNPTTIIVGVIIAILLFFGLPTAAHLYVDLRWFRSLGQEQLFSTVIYAKLALGIAVGCLAGLCLLVSLKVALKLSRKLPHVLLKDPTGTARMDVSTVAERLVWPACGVVALLTGIVGSGYWDTFLRFVHGVDFGTRDPIMGRDVGFYVFTLPGLEALRTLSFWIVGISLAGATAIYLSRNGLVFTGRLLKADRRARLHLTVLGAVFFGVLAFDSWLSTFGLLFSNVSRVAGASYADVHARLPALQLEVATAALGAALLVVSLFRKRVVLIVGAIVLYVAVELLGVRLYPAVIHSFEVVPNEAVKEGPYIAHNIAATRQAYNLESVTERDLSGDTGLTLADVEANRATVENIRLWDHQPLLESFAQIQEIRTYYEFGSVDNDRYVIDGSLRQMMLSPRELAAESLPNRTWINERFTFTHGYGLTLGPVNRATEEGLPVLFVQDIPPTSVAPGLVVTRPEIYFGELSNDHVFVRTKNREFDYPSGDDNVYAEYTGSAGIRTDSIFTRTMLAMRLGSFKILLSDDITSDSRVLLYRNIRERAEKLVPFLRFDRDPYMVVRNDGTLIWIQDAYTTTDRFPYAEPTQNGINYIRSSVKIVIDAYHGTTTLYVADEEDPLLATWRRIFPEAFRPLGEMPADIRSHLRYPEDIFRVQTEMFTVYHMRSAELVYNREDQWEIPTMRTGDGVRRLEPYYTVMRLPGEGEAEFIQMLPFTPKSKQNLAAWMVARMDGDRLGELVIYRFPKRRLVFGPEQIMNRINQDADISRQISLWDQRGSQAILGTLLVIPIEESLIYVCPLYLRSEGGRIPELKRVIVAYENRIAMGGTLDEAIATLFGEHESATDGPDGPAPPSPNGGEPAVDAAPPAVAVDGPPPMATAPPPGEPLPSQARDHYERAVAAQRRGDWATYGEELEALGEILRRLAASDERGRESTADGADGGGTAAATPRSRPGTTNGPAATTPTQGADRESPPPMAPAPAP